MVKYKFSERKEVMLLDTKYNLIGYFGLFKEGFCWLQGEILQICPGGVRDGSIEDHKRSLKTMILNSFQTK